MSSLREPPTDPDDLKDFPSYLLDVTEHTWRIHHVRRDPNWFGALHSGRFDPPPGVDDLFGTCYTADEQTGAFVETFGHDRALPDPVPRVVAVSDIADRLLSRLHPARPLQLADARNRHGLGLFGLTGSISTGGDLDTLATCQRWALAWHQAGFDGVRYAARHDLAGRAVSYAIFGPPNAVDGRLMVAETVEFDLVIVRQLAGDFGFTVLPD